MRKLMGNCLLWGLCLSIFAGCWGTAVAVQAAQAKTIRIGYFEMKGFMSKDLSDNITGYSMDYLNRIAAFTGWEYEFIEVSNIEAGLEALSRHEIDLIAPCQLTQQRLRKYDYTAAAIGTQYSVLVTRINNEKFLYEDYESFNRMQIGIVKNDSLMGNFIQYKLEKGFSAFFHYYDSQQEALTALQAGEIDGAAVSHMMAGDAFKVLCRFSPEPFYYVTWSGNKELVEELNDAIQQIKSNSPGFENSLMQTWFPYYDTQYITREEQEFVDGLGVLNVGYLPDRAPISFLDSKTGEFGGVTHQIFEKISEISGLKFRYVPVTRIDLSANYLKSQGIDLVSGLEHNVSGTYDSAFKISNPYLTSRKVLVARKGTVFNRDLSMTVAMGSTSQAFVRQVEDAYPNFTVVNYGDIAASFDAVLSGEVDLVIRNQYEVENWLSKPQYDTLEILPVGGIDDNLSLAAFAENEAYDVEMLVTIINKAISQLSKDEIDTMIVNESMDSRYVYTWRDFAYRYRYVLLIIAVLVVIVCIIICYVMQLRRGMRKQQAKEQRRLILQQKRYQIIMEESKEMIYEIAIRSGDSMVSDRVVEKFGWSLPQKLDIQKPHQIARCFHIYMKDMLAFEEMIQKIAEDYTTGECKVRIELRDKKQYIWCKISCIPLLDEKNRLVSVVGRIVDIDHDVKEKEHLQLQSRTDGLTGLLNKKTFVEEVNAYLDSHSAMSSAIIFVDLDHFKDVNDKLGHAVGDTAIKEAAQRLQNVFSSYDLVSRFGGDEFCIFIKEIPHNTLENKMDWAVKRMKAYYTDGAAKVLVTASIGVAYCKQDKVEYQAFLDLADSAVYDAKHGGRNQYVLKECAS